MRGDHYEIPRLPAELVNDGAQLRFFCVHCRCWHYHGAEYGDRACHCLWNVDSPYKASGYWLAGPVDLERAG